MTNMAYNLLTKTQSYEFIGNLFYFGVPGNDTMFNLIILFSEIMFIGFAILYLLFEVFEVIIDEFGSEYKRMPSSFTPEVESFLDIFFLLFPTAVIIYILIPTLGFIYSEDLNADNNIALVINITGHQWYWSYQYFILDSNVALEITCTPNPEFEFDAVLLQGEQEKYRLLSTDTVVFFPYKTRILLQITSEDVIHSWAIPQLGIKVDAVPGRYASVILYADTQNSWFGQCSELCGAYHAFMPIHLVSVSPKSFFSLWTVPGNVQNLINGISINDFFNFDSTKSSHILVINTNNKNSTKLAIIDPAVLKSTLANLVKPSVNKFINNNTDYSNLGTDSLKFLSAKLTNKMYTIIINHNSNATPSAEPADSAPVQPFRKDGIRRIPNRAFLEYERLLNGERQAPEDSASIQMMIDQIRNALNNRTTATTTTTTTDDVVVPTDDVVVPTDDVVVPPTDNVVVPPTDNVVVPPTNNVVVPPTNDVVLPIDKKK